MANIKLTQNNFDNRLNDWKNNTNQSRADVYYFINGEINTEDIRQVAWKKNLLINIQQNDEFSSRITYVDVLT